MESLIREGDLRLRQGPRAAAAGAREAPAAASTALALLPDAGPDVGTLLGRFQQKKTEVSNLAAVPRYCCDR